MSYKYALIVNDVVQQVVMSPVVLHFDARDVWMDVSARNPSPNQKWKYNVQLDVFEPPERVIEDLPTLKTTARATIDMAASRVRECFMPDEYGQAELYREKYEQAIDFLTCMDVVHYPDYPLLHVEAKILDIPMRDVADNIIKRRSEWISKLTEIEELRLYGKVNIAFCESESEVQKLVSIISNKLADLGVVYSQ